MPMIF
jgi:MATE family multidrug resistance protein